MPVLAPAPSSAQTGRRAPRGRRTHIVYERGLGFVSACKPRTMADFIIELNRHIDCPKCLAILARAAAATAPPA